MSAFDAYNPEKVSAQNAIRDFETRFRYLENEKNHLARFAVRLHNEAVAYYHCGFYAEAESKILYANSVALKIERRNRIQNEID